MTVMRITPNSPTNIAAKGRVSKPIAIAMPPRNSSQMTKEAQILGGSKPIYRLMSISICAPSSVNSFEAPKVAIIAPAIVRSTV